MLQLKEAMYVFIKNDLKKISFRFSHQVNYYIFNSF